MTSPAVSEVPVDTHMAILIYIHKGLKGDMSPQPDRSKYTSLYLKVAGPVRGKSPL